MKKTLHWVQWNEGRLSGNYQRTDGDEKFGGVDIEITNSDLKKEFAALVAKIAESEGLELWTKPEEN
jgi:hypothetical protein